MTGGVQPTDFFCDDVLTSRRFQFRTFNQYIIYCCELEKEKEKEKGTETETETETETDKEKEKEKEKGKENVQHISGVCHPGQFAL